MNNWKNRLIAYIASLDETVSLEDADTQIHEELLRIKEESYEKNQKAITDNADNYARPATSMGIQEFIALYRDLFYGRQDVFAVRWDSEKTGKHGYAPKCKNEWDRNVCGKTIGMKGACKKCAYRENQEITDGLVGI